MGRGTTTTKNFPWPFSLISPCAWALKAKHATDLGNRGAPMSVLDLAINSGD